MPEIKIANYVFCNYLNDGSITPRHECYQEGVPLYVHMVIDIDAFKKQRACFGIRLPEEEIRENILILKTVTKKSFSDDPNSVGDEILQSMTENDEEPKLTLTMGKSLTQAIDAAMGILKGTVLRSEINIDYPLGSF